MSDFLADMAEMNTLAIDLAGAPLRIKADASTVLVKGITDVVADAKVFVPVDTAATQNSIHAAATGTDRPPKAGPLGDLDVEAGPTTEYSPELEYGAPGLDRAPQAFMGPAFDRNTPAVVEGLEVAATKRVLDT